MSDWPKTFDALRRTVDAALDQHLPPGDQPPAPLHEAMRYALFSGGKRLRPILCLSTAAVFGAPEDRALLPALALEALHTYTLIHDDLPCMDDDDLRRGQPTVHIRFGEANAVLTGDALLTLAFEWLGQCAAPAPHAPCQFVVELAQAGGHHGVIGGQVADLAAEGQPPNAEQLEYIHLHKTAALLRAAVRMGAIAGGADGATLDALSIYGCKLGLAFQIADDVLDETADTATIGKPAGSDRKNNKCTYVSVHGLEAARARAQQLVEEACATLAPLKEDTSPLITLARFVVERTY